MAAGHEGGEEQEFDVILGNEGCGLGQWIIEAPRAGRQSTVFAGKHRDEQIVNAAASNSAPLRRPAGNCHELSGPCARPSLTPCITLIHVAWRCRYVSACTASHLSSFVSAVLCCKLDIAAPALLPCPFVPSRQDDCACVRATRPAEPNSEFLKMLLCAERRCSSSSCSSCGPWQY